MLRPVFHFTQEYLSQSVYNFSALLHLYQLDKKEPEHFCPGYKVVRSQEEPVEGCGLYWPATQSV